MPGSSNGPRDHKKLKLCINPNLFVQKVLTEQLLCVGTALDSRVIYRERREQNPYSPGFIS